MRLKHIYITKEGEPMANPQMPLPLHFKEEFNYTQDDIEDYADGMKRYHSGLLPFEDIHDLPSNIFHRRAGSLHEEPILIPDTLIPVDIEVEVVDQMNVGDGWVPRDYHDKPAASSVEYRKVLRIKN